LRRLVGTWKRSVRVCHSGNISAAYKLKFLVASRIGIQDSPEQLIEKIEKK
jgi:hypothetical protein